MGATDLPALLWLLLLLLLLLLPSSDSSACLSPDDDPGSVCLASLKGVSHCKDPSHTLHCQQDRDTIIYSAVCAPVVNCSRGNYARVDEKNCSIVCERCHADHFQAHQESSNKFPNPECNGVRHRCNQATKVTCLGGLPDQDDRCRCRWEEDFQPRERSCQSACYTEEDQFCADCVKASCPEGHRLNSTFQCAPDPSPAVSPSSNEGDRRAVIALAVTFPVTFVILAAVIVFAVVVIYFLRGWIKKAEGEDDADPERTSMIDVENEDVVPAGQRNTLKSWLQRLICLPQGEGEADPERTSMIDGANEDVEPGKRQPPLEDRNANRPAQEPGKRQPPLEDRNANRPAQEPSHRDDEYGAPISQVSGDGEENHEHTPSESVTTGMSVQPDRYQEQPSTSGAK